MIAENRLGFQCYRCTAEIHGARRNNLARILLFLAVKQLKQWTGFNILISNYSSMSPNGEQGNLSIFSSCAVKMLVALWISYWNLLELLGIIWALQSILKHYSKNCRFQYCSPSYFYYWLMFPRCGAVIMTYRIWCNSLSIFPGSNGGISYEQLGFRFSVERSNYCKVIALLVFSFRTLSDYSSTI